MANNDYMTRIQGDADWQANIMSKARSNAQNGIEDAQSFKVPLVGWKIPAGPFTDKKELQRMENFQQLIRDVELQIRKAREAAAAIASGANH